MQDLILKNGYLFDPPNGYAGQRGDVAIQDGRITGVGKIEEEASQTVDVTGLAVTPGLIDFHGAFLPWRDEYGAGVLPVPLRWRHKRSRCGQRR